MVELQRRFGRLVAGHRRRRRWTQEVLAEAAGLSVDMITRIEAGGTGVSFPAIERLAGALEVDPAELFTAQFENGSLRVGAFEDVMSRLSSLSESDLAWTARVLDAVLERKGQDVAGSTPTKVDSPTLRLLKAGLQEQASRVPTK